MPAAKRTDARLSSYQEKRRFAVTPEPAPGESHIPTSRLRRIRGIRGARKGELEFVVQKHDATRLHYDVRFEIAGTMMSFAVPKGPSYDPTVKRLAVETEDHPMEYNRFEGRIPEGEYGAGPVVIWDRGTYETVPPGQETAMRAKGHLHVRFFGEKLEGDWHFVRTKEAGQGSQWMMFKAKDAFADPVRDPVTERPESVVSGRRLPRDRPPPRTTRTLRSLFGEVEKATLVRELEGKDADFRFEIKYDGYRILAIKSGAEVVLASRNGKDWTDQFPTVAAAVAKLDAEELVLDGEVCALDPEGRPSFNLLQNAGGAKTRLSYAVFDVLARDGNDLRGEPLEARQVELESVLAKAKAPIARSSTIEGASFREVLRVACENGLEGVIAKRKGSRYLPGRQRDWQKLKCTRRQEFAVVGYQPHTGTTNRVGSLLLAVMGEDGKFHYAGKVGTGFDAGARRDLAERIDRHRVDAPMAEGLPRVGAAHFARPKLVAEVAFTEWTPDGKIRHPSYQGLRRDKSPRDCVREE